MKLKSFLACWAWESSMHTEAREKRIRRQIMHRVLVPNMHCEGFFASCIVCLEPFVPSFLQFILKRLHVHIHILPRIFGPWYYQRQENVFSLHNLSGGEIEWHDKYRPTTILSCRHTERVEPIRAKGDSNMPLLFSFLPMYFIEVLPC